MQDASSFERSQIAGFPDIEAALTTGKPVQLVLLHRDDDSPEATRIAALAESHGSALWRCGIGDLTRMSRKRDPERIIAMLGPSPNVTLEGLFERPGAIWLLDRVAYPSNVGFAIRTAEVSGACGIVIDAAFNHEQRSRAAHVSMGAHRVLPVLYAHTHAALATMRAAQRPRRLIAFEDSGRSAPYEVDLTGDVLLIAGNEREGLDERVLAACDATVALPMAGFVPSYNLHAAIAAVAAERLRQVLRRDARGAAV